MRFAISASLHTSSKFVSWSLIYIWLLLCIDAELWVRLLPVFLWVSRLWCKSATTAGTTWPWHLLQWLDFTSYLWDHASDLRFGVVNLVHNQSSDGLYSFHADSRYLKCGLNSLRESTHECSMNAASVNDAYPPARRVSPMQIFVTVTTCCFRLIKDKSWRSFRKIQGGKGWHSVAAWPLIYCCFSTLMSWQRYFEGQGIRTYMNCCLFIRQSIRMIALSNLGSSLHGLHLKPWCAQYYTLFYC